jgi:hypothetical protein
MPVDQVPDPGRPPFALGPPKFPRLSGARTMRRQVAAGNYLAC